ncbi:MAG: DUF1538 family protein, partial [Spirochaetia bacterium]
MASSTRIKVPLRTAAQMLGAYFKARVAEQIRAVAFIIIYLVAFQTIILRTPIPNALGIAMGIAMVVFGLTLFLEGLLLGLMPLGERVGVQLPQRMGIFAIALFGVLVGFGSTFAEPAVAALRTVGTTVTAWDAPLLYALLEQHLDLLITSIAVGVGLAVAVGMVRFYYGLSLKPFIFGVIPPLLVATALFALDENLTTIVGLAWDSGAVTTGAVTVPLVLALGIGLSRATGTGEGVSGGFGIIMLASALPVLGVFAAGLMVNTTTPEPVEEETFFAEKNRAVALELFDSEEALVQHAFTRGSESGRRALFEEEAEYVRTVDSLFNDEEARRVLLGEMTLGTWLSEVASSSERDRAPSDIQRSATGAVDAESGFAETLREESLNAARAVLPLTVLFLVVLLFILRDRPDYIDELVLGIGLSIVGMAVLTSGIAIGLAPLGDEVGSELPRAFESEAEDVEQIVIDNFERDLVFESVDSDGERRQYFYFHDNGSVERVPYVEERYDASQRRYEHVISRGPLFGPGLTILGIALVLLFAFGLGYGSTLAEPALNALGRTVEQLTVGTITRTGVVTAVSLGVGLGLLAGVARILY